MAECVGLAEDYASLDGIEAPRQLAQLRVYARRLEHLAERLLLGRPGRSIAESLDPMEPSVLCRIRQRLSTLQRLMEGHLEARHKILEAEHLIQLRPDLKWSWPRLKSHLHWHSDVFRLALKVSGGFLFIIAFDHFIWPLPSKVVSLIALCLVLKMQYSTTRHLGLQFIGGSLLGMLLALGLVEAHVPRIALMGLIVAVLTLAMCIKSYDYSRYTLLRWFSSCLIVFAFLTPYSRHAGMHRMLECAVGFALALALNRLLPDAQIQRLPHLFKGVLIAESEFLRNQARIVQAGSGDPSRFLALGLLRRELHDRLSNLLETWRHLHGGSSTQRKFIRNREAAIPALRDLAHHCAGLSLLVHEPRSFTASDLDQWYEIANQMDHLAVHWGNAPVPAFPPLPATPHAKRWSQLHRDLEMIHKLQRSET
jgi:uncharacterized membrane protein YccC